MLQHQHLPRLHDFARGLLPEPFLATPRCKFLRSHKRDSLYFCHARADNRPVRLLQPRRTPRHSLRPQPKGKETIFQQVQNEALPCHDALFIGKRQTRLHPLRETFRRHRALHHRFRVHEKQDSQDFRHFRTVKQTDCLRLPAKKNGEVVFFSYICREKER